MLQNNLDFSHIDKIIKNGTTNKDYYRVLGIIGESEKSLTNVQIFQIYNKKKYDEKKNIRHIYKIIKKLSPTGEDVPNLPLFIWEDLKDLDLEKLKEKCIKILEKINQSFNFNVDKHLNENYILLMDGKSLDSSNKWIKIEKNDKNSVNYNPDYDEGFLISICSKLGCQVFPTLTIKEKGKHYVYTKSYSILERRKFLENIPKKQSTFVYTPGEKIDEKNLPREHQLWKDIMDIGISLRGRTAINLHESVSKQNNNKEKLLLNNEKVYDLEQVKKTIRNKTDELNRIMGDRQNFSYTLNFRGLLLFLILYGSARKSKSNRLLFSNVLSNPSIVKIAPFLQYLNKFEELGFKGKDLSVTIAEELRNQLHLDMPDGNFLLERAIERYYKEFQKYFIEPPSSLLSIIKDYEKNIVSLLKSSIKNKQLVFNFSLKDFDFSI